MNQVDSIEAKMEEICKLMKDLPSTMTTMMELMRNMDKYANTRAEEIKEEENKLFEELELKIKQHEEIDEESYRERFQQLKDARHSLQETYDRKLKTATNVYNFLDSKINAYGIFYASDLYCKF